jgi:hypothetical protein
MKSLRQLNEDFATSTTLVDAHMKDIADQITPHPDHREHLEQLYHALRAHNHTRIAILVANGLPAVSQISPHWRGDQQRSYWNRATEILRGHDAHADPRNRLTAASICLNSANRIHL